MGPRRRQAELFRDVGSGRAPCLCSAELQPEALGGRAGAELQRSEGSWTLPGLQAPGQPGSSPPEPCQPTSQSVARTPTPPAGPRRPWMLPQSSAPERSLSRKWWKGRSEAPSTTPLRYVSCFPL